jgi:hypothetical protein
MAVRFHPLPVDAFPDLAQPAIQRLNRELRDLFGLEGSLTAPQTTTKRSDATVARNQVKTVDVTRVAGLQDNGSVASALTQTQLNIINGISNHTFASGFGPVMTVSKAGVATKIMLVPVWDAGAVIWGISISEVP